MMHSMRKRQSEAGFTLIELMVVVAIIAVLAAIGVPKMKTYVRSAEASEATKQFGLIAKGLKAYGDLNPNKTSPSEKVLNDTSQDLMDLIPYIAYDSSNAKFFYKVIAYTAGGDNFCIAARNSTDLDTTQYDLYYSATAVDSTIDGWDQDYFRTVQYVNASTTFVSGGDCSTAATW
ncbi:type II secretion system protein [Magnetococcales bacterium HHB-1]